MTESVGGNSHELVCLHSLAYTIEGSYGSVVINSHSDTNVWFQTGSKQGLLKMAQNYIIIGLKDSHWFTLVK